MGRDVAPIFFFRSALPVYLIDGRDLNLDGDAIDIPAKAYAVDSVRQGHRHDHVQGDRQLRDGQLRTRHVAAPDQRPPLEGVPPGGRARIEAIGEVFNLFNAVNPSGFRTRVTVPTTGLPDPTLLQPTTYSGDFRRPEQRVGQLGFRFSF